MSKNAKKQLKIYNEKHTRQVDEELLENEIPEALYKAIRAVVRVNEKIQEYRKSKQIIPDICLTDLQLQVNNLRDWLPEILEQYVEENKKD